MCLPIILKSYITMLPVGPGAPVSPTPVGPVPPLAPVSPTPRGPVGPVSPPAPVDPVASGRKH